MGADDLGLVHNVPQGAYYGMMDISEFGYDSDLKFCEDLAAKVGVGAVPGSSFFREPVNHLIRFHFVKKDQTLNDALNRLETLCKFKKVKRLPTRRQNCSVLAVFFIVPFSVYSRAFPGLPRLPRPTSTGWPHCNRG